MASTPTLLDLAELKRRREALGYTFQQAAILAGFKSAQQWHIIEAGERSDVRTTTLGSLAKALGCSPCDLLKPSPARKRTKR